MEGVNKSSDAIERQFPEGVAEPNDPSKFLLKILGRTKDDPYDSYPEDQIPEGETLDTLRAKVPARRERIQSVLARISDAAKEVVGAYRQICVEEGLEPGRHRFYVIGGRIRQKPLQHSSDVDALITFENIAQALQPYRKLGGGDELDIIDKKIKARGRFFDAAGKILGAYQFGEKDMNGKTGYLLEIKAGGVSEKSARENWTATSQLEDEKQQAVLIYSE